MNKKFSLIIFIVVISIIVLFMVLKETNQKESASFNTLDEKYNALKSELSIALQSGEITKESYDNINDQIKSLENHKYNKEKISELRNILSQISVGGETAQTPASNYTPREEKRYGGGALTKSQWEQLPDCTEGMLTSSPVKLKEINSIEPIGSTNPPEHTLASSSTDTYIGVGTQETGQTVSFYSPGEIWIMKITQKHGATSDPEDNTITYALCKDVFGIVDHLKSLSPEMQALVDNNKCLGNEPSGYNFELCTVGVFKHFNAGVELGKVGGKQGNFNFGTWDMRHNNTFVNPAKYGERSLHSSCPFDYYSEPLKSQLFELLDRPDKKCGTVEYDVQGTLQGEWFYGNATNYLGPSDWPNQLFLGYSNRFPEAAVVSIGGIISEPLKWHFIPKNSGKINVAFSKVSNNETYCYESDGNYNDYNKGPEGILLLQLVDANTVKAEYQKGTCSGNYEFSNPAVYER